MGFWRVKIRNKKVFSREISYPQMVKTVDKCRKPVDNFTVILVVFCGENQKLSTVVFVKVACG